MDRQPEGGEVRHARRTAPPPVPAAPLPHQPHDVTTELDSTQDAEPVSAAISGVFAERVARELIAQYGAARVEAVIADTSDPKKYPDVRNLAGFVRSRLADGDRVAVETPYDEMTQEQKLRQWLGSAYDPAVHS